MPYRWDIFCKVIDNYGDVGVSWRLARQLAAEHGLEVRLYLDDVAAFCRICPEGDPNLSVQCHFGVTVHRWPLDWLAVEAAEVVIEAFACELPAPYVAAMTECERPPLWLNLEYLSAEDWVAGCHGLPSLQASKLDKYFFFPGFSANTGGLLRESGLIQRRQAFQRSAGVKRAFLAGLAVDAHDNSRLISLFSYENANLSTWLGVLASAETASHVLVPEGRILPDVASYLGEPQVQMGRVYQRGALSIQVLPFLSQDDYDRLLWVCDLNVVRGEDSFVRAQWAGRPFIWHIYPQEDEAHFVKLGAFLQHYCEGLDLDLALTLRECWLAWNRAQDCTASWSQLMDASPALTGHAERWCTRQAGVENLAYSLVQFHQNWL